MSWQIKKIGIDRGIPLPKKSDNEKLYPWDQMEVGDSFFAAGKTFSQLTGSVTRVRKKTGRHFTMRKVTENDVIGIRVWRIA